MSSKKLLVSEVRGIGVSIHDSNIILDISDNEFKDEEIFEPHIVARLSLNQKSYSNFIKVLIQLGNELKKEDDALDLGDLFVQKNIGGE